MRILQWFGIGLIILVVALALLFLRRALFARAGGTIKLAVRLSTMVQGRGWSPGFARFIGDELRWYRMFSFSVRPRRVLSRRGLVVQSRREPTGPERLALRGDVVILRCASQHTTLEIAMAKSTVTGFLSWLESAPPGAVSPHLAAR